MAKDKKNTTINKSEILNPTVANEAADDILSKEGASAKTATAETKGEDLDNTEIEKESAAGEQGAESEEVSPQVLELMRLYPQYSKLWISKKGFVYPENTPEYMLTDATLYTNRFSKQ